MNSPEGLHLGESKEPLALQFLRCCLIFVFLVSFYSLTFSGTFRVDDEHILAARAQSYTFRDHLDYPQVYGNDRVRHLSEVLENSASPVVAIEPGQALLGSLFFSFASITKLDGVQAFFTINLYATAITGVLVFVMVCGLGFKPKTGIATSLLFGIGTMAWPFSKTAFRDPLAMMFVAIGFWGWVLLMNREKLKFLGASLMIFGIGCGVLVKSNVLLTIPAFLISGLTIRHLKTNGSDPISRRLIISSLILILIVLLVAVFLPGTGPFSRLSMANFTSLIRRYWDGLNWQTLLAAIGPFISPTKSVFLFNPILIFIPMALRGVGQKVNYFAIPVLIATFLFTLAQALHLRELWAGNLLWGLRCLLPSLPLLVVLTAPYLEKLSEQKWSLEKIGASAVFISALIIQLAGAIVAWSTPYSEWRRAGLNPYVSEAVWDIRFNVIPRHMEQLTNPVAWDIAWVRLLAYEPRSILIPAALVIAITLSIAGLLWIRKSGRRLKLQIGAISALTICILVAPIYPSLWFFQNDPLIGGQHSELISLVSWAEVSVEKGDLVIVDSYGTGLWRMMMGRWDRPYPWYSLPYEIPGMAGVGWTIGGRPSNAALDLVQGLGTKFVRLIYLTSDAAPDFSLLREQLWFAENLAEVESVKYQGEIIAQGYIFLP